MTFSEAKSYKETIIQYQELREAIYKEVKQHVGRNLVIKGIDIGSARQADKWKNFPVDNGRIHRSEWSWVEAYKHYQNRPNRFELSVWAGSKLCGICYGKPSRAKTKLGLNLIESTPVRPSPLGRQAFPIISLAATFYAVAVGAEEVNVLDPVNDAVAEYYMSKGYSVKATYHGNRVALRKIL